MTNPSPTPPVESEEALAEVLARHQKADAAVDYDAERDVVASLGDVPALCQSLRAAWANIGRFSTLADERHDLLSEERRRNDSLRQHVDELQRTNEKLTARNVELRRQLAQVEKERDDARRTETTAGNWGREE